MASNAMLKAASGDVCLTNFYMVVAAFHALITHFFDLDLIRLLGCRYS